MSAISKKSQSIIEYRLNNPYLTLQEIGNKFGISRERVRQILVKSQVKTDWPRICSFNHHIQCKIPYCNTKELEACCLCDKVISKNCLYGADFFSGKVCPSCLAKLAEAHAKTVLTMVGGG